MTLVSYKSESIVSLPGIFPEFIAVSHMNKGLPGFMDTPHMNKGIPV